MDLILQELNTHVEETGQKMHFGKTNLMTNLLLTKGKTTSENIKQVI